MGKKKQEHRKKVAKRNAQLQVQRKKLAKTLQTMAQEQGIPGFGKAPSQQPVYASTGDFIAKNYDTILNQPDQKSALAFLEAHGPSFS